MADMPTLHRLGELIDLLEHDTRVYLRYSPGPEADASHPSKDHESGLLMPGVSVNPLWPPRWWTRPPEDWVARAVCQYIRELHEGARPWVLTGREVDFGPDNEPLLADFEPIAWVSEDLLREAHARYQDRLNAGQATHPG
jgi:hypothetical protein